MSWSSSWIDRANPSPPPSVAVKQRRRTEGAFTPHRPDGIIDLNGLVKALAIRDAGEALESAGITDWYIEAGGDILTGQDSPTKTVGIVDPELRSRLLCSIALESPRHAVATSGSAERGDHIWTIESASAPEFSQATVIADDIGTEVEAEVVDLRTIRPMDIATVIESVKKTNRCVTVEEAWPQCSVGSEIAARLMEHAFDYLDAPVARVSGKDVPMPYAANLEKLALPTVEEVVAAAKAVSYR